MHRHFEENLAQLKARLVHMGATGEKMLELSIQSLIDRNAVWHAEVFKLEEVVNELQIEIDERVISVLALQHPVAADLRLVVMSSKIAGELERIADQAVNICQNTSHMLRESLDAFVRQDAALAQQVLNTDDKVDAFKNQIFRELLTYMMADPSTIPRALALILISRNLERTADHSTNIAEEVIYLAQGRDVRHHHEEKRREANG
jgi:phosphate transport system protein